MKSTGSVAGSVNCINNIGRRDRHEILERNIIHLIFEKYFCVCYDRGISFDIFVIKSFVYVK